MFQEQRALGLRTKRSSETAEKVCSVSVVVADFYTGVAAPGLGLPLVAVGADQAGYQRLFPCLIRSPW
jgi:hypothetical protein